MRDSHFLADGRVLRLGPGRCPQQRGKVRQAPKTRPTLQQLRIERVEANDENPSCHG